MWSSVLYFLTVIFMHLAKICYTAYIELIDAYKSPEITAATPIYFFFFVVPGYFGTWGFLHTSKLDACFTVRLLFLSLGPHHVSCNSKCGGFLWYFYKQHRKITTGLCMLFRYNEIFTCKGFFFSIVSQFMKLIIKFVTSHKKSTLTPDTQVSFKIFGVCDTFQKSSAEHLNRVRAALYMLFHLRSRAQTYMLPW